MSDSSISEANTKLEQSRELAEKLFEEGIDAQTRLDIHKQLMTALVQLRMTSWSAQKTVRNTKNVTATAKQTSETALLSLQNVYYVQKHLRDQIDFCNSYSLRHNLDLIPVEQFISENTKFQGENVDEHELMMARLRDEERRRLELFVRKTKLQDKRNALDQSIKQLREDLGDRAGLETQLGRFLDGMEGLRQYLYKH